MAKFFIALSLLVFSAVQAAPLAEFKGQPYLFGLLIPCFEKGAAQIGFVHAEELAAWTAFSEARINGPELVMRLIEIDPEGTVRREQMLSEIVRHCHGGMVEHAKPGA